jgi:hypothetical protein
MCWKCWCTSVYQVSQAWFAGCYLSHWLTDTSTSSYLCCFGCGACVLQVNVPGLLKPHPVLAQQLVSLLTCVFFSDVPWEGAPCTVWPVLCRYYLRLLGSVMPLHSELGDPQLTGGPFSNRYMSGVTHVMERPSNHSLLRRDGIGSD